MLPYRVCLGEYQGNHSLVVHSAKGIEWRNIHPDLEKVLRQIGTRDILDLAIGDSGLYYLAYREGVTVRQVLTPEIRNEIISEKKALKGCISKIAFGNGKEFWAVIEENGVLDVVSRLKTREPLSQLLKPKNGSPVTARDVAFLALGKSEKNFVIKIRRNVVAEGHRGVRGRKAREVEKNADIVAATLSPLDNSFFFVTFNDGSYRDGLPKPLRPVVQPHLNPAFSLLRGKVPSPAAATPYFTREPSVGCMPALPSPSWTRSSVAELVLLDSCHLDYTRIQGLFYDGWKHPAKSKPDLRYIYEVKLPGRLIVSYLSYRLEVLRSLGSPLGLERELFHGTSRRCLLGNEPELNKPCSNTSCRLCCILQSSFMTTRAGTADGRTFLRFGRGIYTSSVSSKADDYTVTPPISGYRAMLVARVVLGKGYPLKLTSQSLLGPPSGYHSVLGEVGVHLNYDEQVVYNNDAVRPAYLVVYKL